MVTKSVKKSWLKSAKKKTNSSAKPKASLMMALTKTVNQLPMAPMPKAAYRQLTRLPELPFQCQFTHLKCVLANKYGREQLLFK